MEDSLVNSESVVFPTFHDVFHSNPTPMWLYDLHLLQFIEVNESAIRVYGYSRDEFLLMSLHDIHPVEDIVKFNTWVSDLLIKKPKNSSSIWRHVRKDGEIIDVRVSNSHGFFYEGKSVSCSVIFDVTEHRRSVSDLQIVATVLEQTQNLGDLGYSVMDFQTGKVKRSTRMLQMLGVSDEMAKDQPLLAIVSAADPEDEALLINARKNNLPIDLKYRVIINGENRWWHVVSKVVYDFMNEPRYRLATIHDVTMYHLQAEKLREMAYADLVTGLPNRRALFDWKPSSFPVSALFIHFTLSGDFGAKSDDECWRAVVKILEAVLPKNCFLSRLTEDTFVICNSCDTSEAASLAAAILEIFEEPVAIDQHEAILIVHIGVATSDENLEINNLLRKARTALRGGLRSHHDVEFHSEELDFLLERRMSIERHLRNAPNNDSLSVVYQPIVSLHNGNVVGAEALMRWKCEGIGNISPVEFIPIAEENGMVLELGQWILRKACFQAKEWQDLGFPLMRMAVNVSGRQAERLDFSEIVAQTILAADLSCDFLDLEITETAMMNSHNIAVDNLIMLRSRGFRVSMDDFGTGYSSLSALGTLPVDVVKLDRSFVSEITRNGFAAQLVMGVIDLAHRGGLKVIAEGVETVEQLEALRTLGCDEAQGFLFGQPVSSDKFIADYIQGEHINSFFAKDPISLFKTA